MARKINDLFFMKPWAVEEDTLSLISEVISRHISGEKLSADEIRARIGGDKSEGSQYMVTANGVAVIPIQGVISKRASLVKDVSVGAGTSIEEIKNDLNAALADPAVKSIALDVDSPGGSVDGVAELSDMIYNARGKKPICAFADGQMASAAYWIGSAADKIYASQGADVGSIGVYSVVKDMSRAYKNAGVDTHVIKAGKHKAAGHPLKQMTEEDMGVIQKKVNAHYKMFTDAVRRNRGMSADQVNQAATGECFMADEAQKLGLIDGIDTIESMQPTVKACAPTKRIAASDEIVKCESCSKEFHLIEQPEADAGSVKCPDCKSAKSDHGADPVNAEENTKGDDMKDLTLDALKGQRPDLLEAHAKEVNEASAKVSGDVVATERARVLAIVEKAKQFADVEGISDMVKASIEKSESVEVAEKAFMQKKLDALQKASPAKPGANADEAPAPKSHLELAKQYSAEHKCSMTVALKATAPVRNKK